MNRTVLVVLALLLLAAFISPAHAQNVTCNQAGSQVFCGK